MTKKNRVVRTSVRRRMARVMSRPRTQRKTRSTPQAPSCRRWTWPEVRGTSWWVVSTASPPAGHVVRDQGPEQVHRVRVQGAEGLVQDPQGGAAHQQPGQGDALLLPLGQDLGRQVLEAGQPHAGQGLPEGVVGHPVAVQGRGHAQVLDAVEVALDPVQVAEVEHVAAVVLAEGGDVLAAPADLPGLPGEQAAQGAQQGRLAAAVAPAHVQQGARGQGEAEVREQAAVAAPALEVDDIEHGGPVGWPGRRPGFGWAGPRLGPSHPMPSLGGMPKKWATVTRAGAIHNPPRRVEGWSLAGLAARIRPAMALRAAACGDALTGLRGPRARRRACRPGAGTGPGARA